MQKEPFWRQENMDKIIAKRLAKVEANSVPTNPLMRPYQIIGLLLPGLLGFFQPNVASPKYRCGQR